MKQAILAVGWAVGGVSLQKGIIATEYVMR